MMRHLILTFFFIFMRDAFALSVSSVEVVCMEQRSCFQLEKAFKSLRREYVDLEHFKETIKLYVANEGVKKLNYKLINESNNYKLRIHTLQKHKVLSIDELIFKGNYEVEIPSVLPLKEDEYFDDRKLNQTKALIREVAKEKGFPDTKVKERIKYLEEGVNVSFDIDLGEPIIVSKINILSKSSFLKEKLLSMIGENLGEPFDLQSLKATAEEARKLFLQFGYYLAEVDLKPKFIGKKKIVLFLDIKNSNTYVFHLKNLITLHQDRLKHYLSNSLIGFKREMNVENVKQALKEKLLALGFKESLIEVKKKKYKDVNGEPTVLYDVFVDEGVKVKISEIDFKGSSYFTKEELIEMFFKNGSGLISAGVHDESYYKTFLNLLRERFISNGYVSVFIEEPLVNYNRKSKQVKITYRIREGIRSQIRNIKITGVEEDIKTKILEQIDNKMGKFFNPISFKNDLSYISAFLKNEGYYFSKIKNLNSRFLVSYDEDNSVVNIKIEIEARKKLFVGDIIIIGNTKTRKLLIRRELRLKGGELVTVEKIEKSQVALLSLGIFNSVQIQPVSNNKSKTDILVFVREKDFGLIEVAPGIRSDIGLKLSTIINYNNIDGMNKRVTFKGAVNQRLNLNSLDPTRREESSSLIEYDTAINYSENHLFHSDYDFGTQISKSRKRFYSFDADIQRLTLRLSRDLNDWFNYSFKYQIETISQFNATVEREHGYFQIGSFTPAVSFDFRDRIVNPTKGAHFNLSCEFANPALLSQSNDELTINYYKLMNRNKFYIPMSRDVVIAISTAVGIQENIATSKNSAGETEGYIPNIKVFRLSGADIVRGFEDDEINRLVSNQDISEVEVNSRAYMANLKFEPRLFLSDSTVLGVFYDAGRIFVDEFRENELRSSVGLSFKYLTPVGTLDFDYGIKLLRNRDADGTLDSPGRLHVSIGFF